MIIFIGNATGHSSDETCEQEGVPDEQKSNSNHSTRSDEQMEDDGYWYSHGILIIITY